MISLLAMMYRPSLCVAGAFCSGTLQGAHRRFGWPTDLATPGIQSPTGMHASLLRHCSPGGVIYSVTLCSDADLELVSRWHGPLLCWDLFLVLAMLCQVISPRSPAPAYKALLLSRRN